MIELNIQDVILEKMQDAIDRLIQNHESLGMRTTGNWVNELDINISRNKAQLLGAGYTEQLTKGQKPGTFPNVESLKRWVQIKFRLSGEQLDKATYLIGRKIEREGTTWYKKGGSDLLEKVINNDFVDEVLNGVAVVVNGQIQENLQRQLEEV